jgi:hypothetical protein
VLVCVAVVAGSGTAAAQSTYVSASLIGDIVRSSHTETPGLSDSSGGEALGFALRVGTPLGSNWGVEAEFARPSRIEHDMDLGTDSLAYWSSLTTGAGFSEVRPSQPGLIPVFPPTASSVSSIRAFGSSSERTSTMSASLWVQQQLSGRVAMMYLAGMGFYRSENTYRITYEPLFIGLPFPGAIPELTLPAFDTTSVSYGVRPLAGIESRITMTDHIQLVPGVRIHGAKNGWLIRPSIGLAWAF